MLSLWPEAKEHVDDWDMDHVHQFLRGGILFKNLTEIFAMFLGKLFWTVYKKPFASWRVRLRMEEITKP